MSRKAITRAMHTKMPKIRSDQNVKYVLVAITDGVSILLIVKRRSERNEKRNFRTFIYKCFGNYTSFLHLSFSLFISDFLKIFVTGYSEAIQINVTIFYKKILHVCFFYSLFFFIMLLVKIKWKNLPTLRFLHDNFLNHFFFPFFGKTLTRFQRCTHKEIVFF